MYYCGSRWLCSLVFIGSGGEDEQEDSRSGETERRAQTDRAGALFSINVCLSDQWLAVDAQMTAHPHNTTRAPEPGKYKTVHICVSDLHGYICSIPIMINRSYRGLSSECLHHRIYAHCMTMVVTWVTLNYKWFEGTRACFSDRWCH